MEEEEVATSKFIKKPNPFENMKIDDNGFLKEVKGRQVCKNCNKSRKFFCYTCYLPLDNVKSFPKVQVNLNLNIFSCTFFCKCADKILFL